MEKVKPVYTIEPCPDDKTRHQLVKDNKVLITGQEEMLIRLLMAITNKKEGNR